MSEQFEWHWQTRIKELEARIEALEAALRRIERGATSVLLDATLKDNPVHPDVLQEIIKDVHAALAQKRTTGPNPDPPPDKYGIGRRGG